MKKGSFMSLTALGMALAVFACRDVTAPSFGTEPDASHMLNPVGTVVVSPGNMRGWAFSNDQTNAACDGAACLLVSGPASPPAGSGSAELATPLSTDGKALVLRDYKGTRFDAITDLHYATYRQSADAGNNLAIALQFNVDYDLTDQATGYQGRLVYEPYQGAGSNVPQQTWQTWDAKAGKWWGTRASASVGGVARTNPCVQATPCTWSQLLATFPNVGVHNTYGAVVLKAGSSWPGFRGNVDKLTIGIEGVSTTFDFELQEPAPASPPDSVPRELFAALGTVSGAPLLPGTYIRDIVIVDFEAGTTAAGRQAAFDAVAGVVVGGRKHFETPSEGVYYLRVPGGTASSLLHAVMVLQALSQVSYASTWALTPPDQEAYRRPMDGEGAWRNWRIDTLPAPSRENWALEYVQGPMAWGCAVGSTSVGVAVVDAGAFNIDELRANVDVPSSALISNSTSEYDHATRVASVLAASGNDSAGMTGMIWKAKLTLRDRFASFIRPGQRIDIYEEPQLQNITEHIVAAGMVDGVSVINVSLAIFYGMTAQQYNPTDSAVIADIEEKKATVTKAIKRLRVKGKRPLIVISAGNSGLRTARAAGYAAAKEDFSDQVLVVGALDSDGNIWERSNRDTLVDVYAPGVGVTQANRSNSLVRSDDGTSFSAPLASGVAALLKDFDPSLTAADMVTMITDGARMRYGVKQLDAYGALKQAARRPNAPLCGNRVYKSGDKIVALRGDGGPAETLINLPGQTADSGNSNVNVYHGGKRIDLSFSVQYDWKSGSRLFEKAAEWSYDAGAIDGGTFLSGTGVSHDYEVHAYAFGPGTLESTPSTTHSPQLAWTAGSESFQMKLVDIPVSRPTTEFVVGQVPASADGIHFDGSFIDYNKAHVGRWTQPRMDTRGNAMAVALSPGGKYALVAVNFVEMTTTATSSLRDCTEPAFFDLPPARCADGTEREVSEHANIYRVDLVAQSVPRLIKTLSGVEIAWLSLTERDDELVWQTVQRSTFSDFRYAPFGTDPASYGGAVDSLRSSLTTCTGRRIEYMAFDSASIAPNPVGAARIVPVPVVDGCNDDHSYLAGTMSPSRTPSNAMGLEALKATTASPRSRRQRRAQVTTELR